MCARVFYYLHTVDNFFSSSCLMAAAAFYLNHTSVCSWYLKYAAPLPLECSDHVCNCSHVKNTVFYVNSLMCKLRKPGLIYWLDNLVWEGYFGSNLGTHLHLLSDFPQTAIQPLGASPIIHGLPLEEANFRFELPSPRAACCLQSDCLQSDARMELELRDHIYQPIFSYSSSVTVRCPTTKDYNRKPGLSRNQDRPTLPTDSTFSECRVDLWRLLWKCNRLQITG